MRTLVMVPIIRSEMDRVSQCGEQFRSADALWSWIRRMIAEAELPHASVRLYQDALPVCEKEHDIVREAAARGSQNHQLLAELMEQGARLMGTEDPELLLQEYQFLQSALGRSQDPDQENRRKDQAWRLIADRDRFIAGRINATLAAGEIGLLFLGTAHSVEPCLDADIVVKRLLPGFGDGRIGLEPNGERLPMPPIGPLRGS